MLQTRVNPYFAPLETSSSPPTQGPRGAGKPGEPEEAPAAPKSDGWINVEQYREAGEAFNTYDPEEWLQTLRFPVGAFVFWPWMLICLSCLAANTWVELSHDVEPGSERRLLDGGTAVDATPPTSTSMVASSFWTGSFLPMIAAVGDMLGPAVSSLLEELEPHHLFSMPIDAHVVMGSALAFLVVMRLDGALKQWREAREAWQTVIDACLSLGAQTSQMLKDDESRERLLMQLIALTVSLKCHLREEAISRDEIGARMEASHTDALNKSACPPVAALRLLSQLVRESLPTKKGDAELGPAIFDEVSEQVRVINHAVGECTRIKTTPMTLGYVTALRSGLMLWLATFPMALIGKFGWMATPALAFIAYLFITLEQTSVEIEQPFGNDANDLPQELYILELHAALLEMAPGYEPPPDEDDLAQERQRVEAAWAAYHRAAAGRAAPPPRPPW
jgi:putative membrane protein